MTPAGIEPATFRIVAQHLNHCATAVPTVTGRQLYCSQQIYRIIYNIKSYPYTARILTEI